MATKNAKSTIRMEGLTLAVADVKRSVAFYRKKLGLKIEIDSAPHFALVRVGLGASIGLLATRHAVPKGTKPATKARMGINPFTKQEQMFKAKPARKVIKVRALKALKDMAK